MFPYGPLPKAAKWTTRDLILRALARGPANNQADLRKDAGVDDLKAFNATLTNLLSEGGVIETKTQLRGTGHDGPPVFEYTYSLPKKVKS